MPADYETTARNLSLPIDDPYQDETSAQQRQWRRFPLSPNPNLNYRDTFRQKADKLHKNTVYGFQQTTSTVQRLVEMILALSLVQKILLAVAGILGLVVAILFLRYGESMFAWIAPIAKSWREMRFGWMILWFMTFIVSFPPLVGYSSCVMIAGFVYGVSRGWLLVASATILGSTCSFLASRTLLSSFVHRNIASDRRFSALALTLKHDGLKLLIMIRLCPLPYSISNGAIATFPTVTMLHFALATACATPKLLIHCFVGSRIASIAEDQDGMDASTKALNWFSIALGLGFGIFTSWFIYRQTKRRAAELEAQEGNGGEDFEDEMEDEHSDDGYYRDGPAADGHGHGHGHGRAQGRSIGNGSGGLGLSVPHAGGEYGDERSRLNVDGKMGGKNITLRVTRPSAEGYRDEPVSGGGGQQQQRNGIFTVEEEEEERM